MMRCWIAPSWSVHANERVIPSGIRTNVRLMHRARDEESLDGGHAFVPKPRADSARPAVERGVLSDLVGEGLSIRQIAERLDRSPTSVRRWLSRYGLKTAGVRGRRPVKEREHDGPGDARLPCPKLGLTSHRWFSDRGYRCLRCRSMYVADRRRHIKASLVEEAGGRCILCGYARCLRALSFHHVDPTTKSFGIALNGSARALARAREEARKCVLLCSNCHAEVEAGQVPASRLTPTDRARHAADSGGRSGVAQSAERGAVNA